eukprot:scaffold140516_cov36-Tisochrysis_lutea.AAC.5
MERADALRSAPLLAAPPRAAPLPTNPPRAACQRAAAIEAAAPPGCRDSTGLVGVVVLTLSCFIIRWVFSGVSNALLCTSK